MTDRLSELRAKFLARCGEDAAALREVEGDARRRIVHRIAGAAGMFGFADLGAMAGRIDDAMAAGDDVSDDEMAALAAALEAAASA